MKTLTVIASAGIALAATPAIAQDRAGDVQVKVLGTGVLPDGEIDQTNVDLVGLPAGTDTKANDNFVPTIAVEYFISENFSVETIAGTTLHDVDAVSGLPGGTELVSDALLLPATVTAKVHFDAGGIRPYAGAGVAYFVWLDVDDDAAGTRPLGVTNTTLSDEFGFVLQAGVDIPVGDEGFGVTLDAKRYFIGTTARWFVGNTLVIENEHNLDPWVLSAGVAYRF
ncbi:OmpW family protein [Erythrobacter sp. JK5]|uniref:OmpW/AlkL family protein n=1 Tax=Erythrobacter sp. JK5 TaxID=2829500 RepID=UPI001BAD4C12|nr:OmpW family outer membrane protein [Erythrobacter sp. JK5]QUL38009.1 OmpW family protein [Erythrobacter sp. JK5]